MFGMKEWEPDWLEYENTSSQKLSEICCLSLNVDPQKGQEFIEKAPAHYECFIRYKNHEKRIGEMGLGDLLFGSEDKNDPFHLYNSLGASDADREILFLKEEKLFFASYAEELGITDDLLHPEYLTYSERFGEVVFLKMLNEGYWDDSKVKGVAYSLWVHFAELCFISTYNDIYQEACDYFETIQHEDGEVSFTDFVEWADSYNLPLPEGFPRPDTPANEMTDYLQSDGITWVDRLESEPEPKEPEPLKSFPSIEEPMRKTEQWLFVKEIIDSYRSDTGKPGSKTEIVAWLKQGRVLDGYSVVSVDGDKINSKTQSVTIRTLSEHLPKENKGK